MTTAGGQPEEPRILAGFSEIARQYDVAIIDLWGVVHDGTQPYPHVLDCLWQMKDSGIERILLSNAPRRATAVSEQIARIGIPPNAYDSVVSSGEIAYLSLAHGIPQVAPSSSYYYLGPTKDTALLDGLDYTPVTDIADAAFLLVTGLRHDETETVEDYRSELKAAAERKLPLVCANPDLRVMRGAHILLCAGALAARYVEMGGEVIQFGKPHRAAYEACLGQHDADRSRVVAIGDTPRTDLAGAINYGIDAIFVAGGLHRQDVGDPVDPDRLAQFLSREGTIPMAVLEALRW